MFRRKIICRILGHSYKNIHVDIKGYGDMFWGFACERCNKLISLSERFKK